MIRRILRKRKPVEYFGVYVNNSIINNSSSLNKLLDNNEKKKISPSPSPYSLRKKKFSSSSANNKNGSKKICVKTKTIKKKPNMNQIDSNKLNEFDDQSVEKDLKQITTRSRKTIGQDRNSKKILAPSSSSNKLDARKNPIKNNLQNNEKNTSTKKASIRKSATATKTTREKTNKKKNNKITNCQEALKEALIRLHSSSTPESLPCRENQFNDIYNFVSRKLIENEGGCMYISGVPGTGKTATLRDIKKKLCQEMNDGYLPKFKFIEINGLKLAQPNRFFSHFLMELDGIKKNNYQATDILYERFTSLNQKKEFIILFIDELDYLRTKKQDILYHIFDWPNKKNSKLITLAVANSMDLPERFLVNRVSSRLGFTRQLFQPYSHEELKKIVLTRISDLNKFEIFEPDALELICRKVSAVSGDARRVLDICRRAVEISISDDNSDKVDMKIVDKALKEIFHSIKIFRIMKASVQEQIFLRAFLQNYRSTGLEEYQFIEIYNSHVDICNFEGHYIPNTCEFSKVAANLDSSKLIFLEKSHSHLYRRIRLNISPDDIAFGLNLE